MSNPIHRLNFFMRPVPKSIKKNEISRFSQKKIDIQNYQLDQYAHELYILERTIH